MLFISCSQTEPESQTLLAGNPVIEGWYADPEGIITPDQEDYYIVYHRRPLDTDNPHHRVVSIDRMYFDEDGFIQPIKMTFEGVEATPRAHEN